MGRRDAVQVTLECAAEWRRLGARVTYEPGWETRGNGTSADYEGVIVHHTVGNSSKGNPNPTRGLLIRGRSDLSGPLCNTTGPWCTDDDPWIHVIAAHPANHAGASGGRSMGPLPVTSLFNKRVWGHEIDYLGTRPMTGGQYRAALICSRGVVNVLRRSTEYVRAHAETSVTGKWDIGYANGKTYDMAAFRRDAAGYQEDDMPSAKEVADEIWTRPVTGVDGKKYPIGAAIQTLAHNAHYARIDAAVARKLAEETAKGQPVNPADLDALVQRISEQVTRDLEQGWELALQRREKPEAGVTPDA